MGVHSWVMFSGTSKWQEDSHVQRGLTQSRDKADEHNSERLNMALVPVVGLWYYEDAHASSHAQPSGVECCWQEEGKVKQHAGQAPTGVFQPVATNTSENHRRLQVS